MIVRELTDVATGSGDEDGLPGSHGEVRVVVGGGGREGERPAWRSKAGRRLAAASLLPEGLQRVQRIITSSWEYYGHPLEYLDPLPVPFDERTFSSDSSKDGTLGTMISRPIRRGTTPAR
jgi:hypothetical protein